MVSPFVKQCFVTTGASVHMASSTLIMAYTSGLVVQLRKPDSEIPVDQALESWIAAVPSIAGLLGSMLVSIAMACLGRKLSQIASILASIIGWLAVYFAKDITLLLIGRFFKGLSMGSSLILVPILVGEYASPKYRGSFLMFTGLLSALNVLLAHGTGLYLHWRTNAIIGAGLAIANLPVAILSPETPSWLITRKKYDECQRAFRWLRGNDEEEELANMIKASEITHQLKLGRKFKSKMTIREKIIKLKSVIVKKEFYKPIFIMIHVYTVGQWAGSHLLNTYVFDLIENITGKGYNEHALGLNINRLLGAALAIWIIMKTKRKNFFLVFSALNAVVLLVIAAYTYWKSNSDSVLTSPTVGIVLMHLQMVFVTSCTLPMPYVIAGEIFPLRYKSIAGGFTFILISINTVVYLKTFPYLMNSIGIYGAYTLYAGIMIYCLLMVYFYMPETKDRTLQEIEEEVVGKPLKLEELKSVQSLIIEPVKKDQKD
ncbi:facilitated trehalose transporter Tret1-like isoform X1 [Ostrinia furnacalis]|uniref:facilitated trehalose transporter Tret1-like isoform X1 n=2 Tax=Ostrinia furnacalis TaxID=93504 RepID=UPI00103DC4EA|nr:facilitated trehalose transporter Tret1-like isoform X1 [Ostrinia furnacalis]